MTSSVGRWAAFGGAAATAIGLVAATPVAAFTSGITTRISVAADGTQGDGDSTRPRLSADGRFVAFDSVADNLMAADTDTTQDVYVVDRTTGEPELVSVTSSGTKLDAYSSVADVSADGRYVLFSSQGALVPEDTNGWADVYRRDRVAGTTQLVSVSSTEGLGNGDSYGTVISPNGRYALFHSYSTNLDPTPTTDISAYLRDIDLGTTTLISVNDAGSAANAMAFGTGVSDDGRYAIVSSQATNLDSRDTALQQDVFVRDLVSHTTRLISVSLTDTGGDGNSFSGSITGDGRYVAFASSATNLVADDTNGLPDVFVRDRVNNTTTRVSLTPTGGQMLGPDANIDAVQIARDGRYVVFVTDDDELVNGDVNAMSDAFVRDLLTGTTSLASNNTAGAQANLGVEGEVTISADGTTVAFSSFSTNLATSPGTSPDVCSDEALVDGMPAPTDDTNCRADVFVYQWLDSLPATGLDAAVAVLVAVASLATGGVLVMTRRLLVC